MIFADALTGGIIGGTIAAVACLLIAVALIVVGLRVRYDGGILICAGALLAVSTVVGFVWASWPFAYDYHHWVDKEITVKRSNSRLLTDSNGNIQQKIVVTDDKGHFYGINETRATLLEPGNTVRLRCKKAYDFGVPRAVHGWDCKWNDTGEALNR